MVKKYMKSVKDYSKLKITPKMVRQKIGELENLEMRLQVQIIPKAPIGRKNQAINLLEQTQAKKRELYFILHDMLKRGQIEEERQRKMKDDWDKNKCPKCEQAKIDDYGKCPNCGFERPVIARLDTPFTPADFEIGKQILEESKVEKTEV